MGLFYFLLKINRNLHFIIYRKLLFTNRKLLFNPFSEPPQPTSDCPRQFGYFRLGDETKCGQFLNCVNGIGHKFDCPEGLAFNELTFRCDWPDQVDTCDAEGE